MRETNAHNIRETNIKDLSNIIKLVKNNAYLTKKFPKEVIPYLLKAAENSDNKTRNNIENHLVKIGESGIPILVNELKNSPDSVKALIAMVFIRLGGVCIEPLKYAYKDDLENSWMISYIIREIEGTKKPLNETFEFESSFHQEILAG
ncbi:MAG: hypothetical protein V2B14_02120 [bacterium]